MSNRGESKYLSLRPKVGIVAGALCVLILIGLLVFRVVFLAFVDNYELGYIYHARTGKVERLDRTGYVIALPFVDAAHTIDLRPGQVCMNANSRVLNCKLVRFNPDGFDKFLELHGRGAGEGSGDRLHPGVSIYEILKSYAFNVNEGRDCPFLIILDDMRRKESPLSLPAETPTPQ